MNQKKKPHFFTRWFRNLNVVVAICLLLSFLSTHISPEKIAWLSLFGISFPVWLGSNILFFGWWLVRRKKYIFISLIAMLVGIGHVTDFIQISFSSSAEKKENTLKVMSYNVRLFGLYTWEKNKQIRDAMMEQIKAADADVMSFQEFYYTEKRNAFETKEVLLDIFPSAQVHEKYTHELIHSQFFGVATFSKFPIVGKGYIEFHNDRNNFCIYSDIKINKDTIRFFNGHFASIRFQPEDYEYIKDLSTDAKNINTEKIGGITKRLTNANIKRASQIEKVMEEVARSPFPVVLTGDFNDAPVSYAYQTVKKQLTDSFTEAGNGIGNTYIGAFPSFRIDYIFHDDNFEAHQYNTMSEKHSDHHAITSVLELIKD